MIRNIIFDMGNVLCDFNPVKILESLPMDPANRQAIWEELFCSPQWILMDAGYCTEAQLMETVSPRLTAYPGATERVIQDAYYTLDHWFDFFPEIPETLEIVKSLKASGYRLFLLSNANTRFSEYQDRVEAFSYMDGLFVSAFYQCMKPEREIYEKMLETFGIKAEESLFIDDNHVNIAGALICGIDGIVYKQDPELLKQALRVRGVRL